MIVIVKMIIIITIVIIIAYVFLLLHMYFFIVCVFSEWIGINWNVGPPKKKPNKICE